MSNNVKQCFMIETTKGITYQELADLIEKARPEDQQIYVEDVEIAE